MNSKGIIEIIKAEIERLRDEYTDIAIDSHYGTVNANHVVTDLEQLLSSLSTLESENPMNSDEELDQEIIKCWQEWISPSNKQSVDGVLPLSEFAFYARHFAEWGAEHLKK